MQKPPVMFARVGRRVESGDSYGGRFFRLLIALGLLLATLSFLLEMDARRRGMIVVEVHFLEGAP